MEITRKTFYGNNSAVQKAGGTGSLLVGVGSRRVGVASRLVGSSRLVGVGSLLVGVGSLRHIGCRSSRLVGVGSLRRSLLCSLLVGVTSRGARVRPSRRLGGVACRCWRGGVASRVKPGSLRSMGLSRRVGVPSLTTRRGVSSRP